MKKSTEWGVFAIVFAVLMMCFSTGGTLWGSSASTFDGWLLMAVLFGGAMGWCFGRYLHWRKKEHGLG